MGISVTFYKHNKKVNSTALPVAAAGTFGTLVELKDAVDLFSPVLILSTDLFTNADESIKNPMEYNYCWIPDFNRYYFIKNWSWIMGRWECDCEVDVLATFKTEIGNTTAYVTRSASAVDGNVIDTKYPAKREIDHREQYLSPAISPWNINLDSAPISSGFYCVGIANNDINAIGAVSYYAVSVSAMREFMNIMYSAPNWMGITDASLSTDLQKMLLNPLQYVVSCMWIPTGFDTNGVSFVSSIPYGWWTLPLQNNYFYRLTRTTMTKVIDYTFPLHHHPQRTQETNWLNIAPYTITSLNYPPFGMIPIDSMRIVDSNGLGTSVWLDIITGKATLYLYRAIYENGSWSNQELIYQTVSQLGVPITLAQMAVDMNALGGASGIIAAAGMGLAQNGIVAKAENWVSEKVGTIMSNPRVQDIASHLGLTGGATSKHSRTSHTSQSTSLIGTAQKMLADVGNAVLASLGQCSSSGATGAFAMLSYPCCVTQYYQLVVDMDVANNGRPLCRNVQINTLSGFVLCGSGENFTANCMPAERTAVVNYMESGFYYE